MITLCIRFQSIYFVQVSILRGTTVYLWCTSVVYLVYLVYSSTCSGHVTVPSGVGIFQELSKPLQIIESWNWGSVN